MCGMIQKALKLNQLNLAAHQLKRPKIPVKVTMCVGHFKRKEKDSSDLVRINCRNPPSNLLWDLKNMYFLRCMINLEVIT